MVSAKRFGLRLAIGSAVALSLLLPKARAAEPAAAPSSAPRPNIVVLLSDDMPWGAPGFQGGTAAATPNLDRLAREGTRLTQFYVQPVCSPTRSCLMTGRYPFHNGMEERSHGNDVGGMLTDERTIAQALKDANYATAIFGKWHLGSWYAKHLPMARGFDHQYGFYNALVDYFEKRRDAIYDWHRDQKPLQEEGYTTFLIANEFVRVLGQQDGSKPFFYYVAFNAVHGPMSAPPEYMAKHRGDVKSAALECMDVSVGRILDALQRKGVLDNTLVVFFNDNGAPAGQDKTSNKPYRDGKGTTYEGGIRVPCVVRWPGKVPAGAQVDGMIHTVDLYPTFIRLAGGSLEQPLKPDGMDMWETIAQGKPSPRTEIIHSVQTGPETGQAALRQGDFKLVEDELYNIKDDPYETKDIAAKNPDKVKAMKERIAVYLSERRTPEEHGRAPGGIPAIYGEEENKPPLPDWLVKLAAENQKKAAEESKTGKAAAGKAKAAEGKAKGGRKAAQAKKAE